MEIKTKKITNKISIAERETHIYRDDDGWTMDSTVPKDFNAALRKGWSPVEQTPLRRSLDKTALCAG